MFNQKVSSPKFIRCWFFSVLFYYCVLIRFLFHFFPGFASEESHVLLDLKAKIQNKSKTAEKQNNIKRKTLLQNEVGERMLTDGMHEAETQVKI